MPTPNENLLNLHKNISARDPKFTMPYDAFEAKMQDEGNRKSLYKNLSQRDPDFKMEYEDFTAKIGYGVDNGVYNTGENGVDNTGEKPNTESGFWAAQRNAWISKGRSIQYGLADQIHNLSDEKIKEDIFKFAKAGIIPLQSENPADYDNVIQKTQEQISDLQKAREPIMSEVENKKRKEIQAYKDAPGTFRSLFLGKPGILKEDLYSDPEITAIDKQIKELNDITKAALTARGILVTQGQFAVKKAASDAHYGDENEWGERTMKKAADVMRNLPEPVGFMGKAGSMVPDIAGSAVGAITAIFNAPAGAAIIHLNMATMGAQSYGSTLFQIDEYAKETGKEIDEDTRQMVAVGGALVEGITEYVRIPGITAPMKKMSGQMAKRLFLKEAIKNPTLAVDMVKGFVGKNTTLAKRLAAGLWDIAKLSNRQGLEEAAEEAVSSIGQDFLSYAYLNPEDTPGFSEMLSNATNAAKMAYMTGPVFGSINKYGKYRNVRQARQSNGFVTLIADNKGNTFEGLYEKDNGDYVAADINGSEKTIKADEVGEISRFGTRDFERLTAMAKKGQEASAELYANAELDLEHKAIESQIKAKLYQGQEQHQLMVNGVEQENAQVIITVETIDGNQYQVIDGFVNKPEPSAPIIGINLKTGEKTIISPINISKTDVVPADQMRAELRAEAQNRIKDKYQLQSIAAQIQDEFQPGDIVTFNGQEAEIVDVTDPTQGVSIKITDAKGGEQVFTIAPDQLGALQNPDQGSQNPDQPTHTQTFTVGKKKFNYTESEDGVIFIEFEGGKDESKAIIAEVDDTKYDVKTISEEVPIPDAPPFAKVKTRTVAKGLQITPKAAKKPIELPSSKPKAASTEIKFNSPVNTPNGQGILKERIQGTDIYNVEMQSGGIKTFRMEQLNQVTTNEQGTAVTQEANQPIHPATEQVTNQPTQGAETAVQPSAEPVGSGTAEVATPILEGTNQAQTPEVAPEQVQDTPASQAPASPDVNDQVAGVNGEIAQAEAQVNTEPTEGQKEAGNYQKGHVTVQGLDITIENPKGSTRSGVDKDGNAWSVEMKNTYGYFKRTNGKDGDQIDVFIGDNPLSEKVFVVDQLNDKGEFDESKVMIGFETAIKAKAAYMSNYSPGWKGFGSITETSVEDFKEWLYDGARQRKAFAEYKDTPNPRPTTAGAKMEQILDADLKAKAEQAKAKAEKQALADKKSERARRAAENKAKRESLNLEQGDDAYTAYLKAIESGDVTEEALSNMTDHDYIMRFSSNPLEILNAINKIDHYIPEDQLDKVEAAIAAYMTKVPPASAARFGDRNAFAMNMARSYFAKKGETSLTLDQIAQLASGVFGDYSSEAVTPDDVWNFILKYPNGVNSFYKQINPEYKELKDKFYDLTGVDISSTIFERAKQIMAEKDQASPIPTIEDFLGMSPDDMIKLEKEYEDFINENQANDERTKDEGETGEVHGPGTTGIRDGLPEEGRKTIRKPVQEEKPGEPTKGKPTRAEQPNQPTPEKGDKVRFTLGGKEYTLPFDEIKVQPNGNITFDLFGMKSLKSDEFEVIKPEVKTAGEKLEQILSKDKEQLPKAPAKPKTYGKSNKIFTEDAAAKAREALKKKFGNLNVGIDPETMINGMTLAGYHIEAGARKFTDFAAAMIEDAGNGIKPYLKSFYEGIRNWPGFDTKDLDSADYVRTFDVENFNTQDNVSDRPGSGKQDSPNAKDEISANEGAVSDDRSKSGQVGDGTKEGDRNSDGRHGGKSGSGLFASLFGEQGNNDVHPANQGPVIENNDAGDFDGRGSDIGSPEGYIDNNSKAGEDGNTDNERISSSFQERTRQRVIQQKKVESVPVQLMDEANIRESLPVLLPEQQDDVLKAEKRFFGDQHKNKALANGKGMLFTNGTGTGKTFTALGVIKRFAKQGKTNILIVVPSEAKINDWIKDAELLGLSVNALINTKDQGKGINITTYATFRANENLKNRDLDLVVYDESHRIMEEKKGTASATTFTHYQMANTSVREALNRITSVHPVWVEVARLREVIRSEEKLMNNLDMMDWDYAQRREKVDKLDTRVKELTVEQTRLLPSLTERAEKAYENTKVVFLSATPFKGHFNLRYAKGALFNWDEETVVNNRGSRVDGESRFFLENFGSAYEWKYHRLQVKENSNAEAIAMQEVEFAEKLMRQGVMSGRAIESDKDYSREFPLVALENSEVINRAYNDIYNHETKEFDMLVGATQEVFGDYQYKTRLFESLKASMILPRMEKHLAMGRKIVVFHRRKQANVEPPFALILRTTKQNAFATLNDETTTLESKEKAALALEQVDIFEEKYSDLLEYEQTLNYSSAIDQIVEKFGAERVVQINGDISKKDKPANIEKFNNDNSGVDIIIVQEEAGKEGISLHDTSGEHQRVLMSLSLPISSTTALQIEGRIFRIGQETDAIFENPLLGLDMEVAAFGQTINKKLSTTENLAIGNQARDLLRSFAEGVLFNSSQDDPNANQGRGGKEYDKKAQETLSEFRKAVLVYNTNQKTTGKRDQREGVDYFATPEPVGQKMVEWLNINEGESVLEPSAGHGAIAMWFPANSAATVVEPSYSLFSKLTARAGGGSRKLINDIFENLNAVNKFHGIAMNPPFGAGGKTAMEHVEKAFNHLKNGGRLVALIPNGQMDKRMEEFLYGTDKNGKMLNPDAHLVASINLPSVTFKQAGTSVSSRIVVIDRIELPTEYQIRQEISKEENIRVGNTRDAVFMTPEEKTAEIRRRLAEMRNNIGNAENIDLSYAEKVDDLFDAIEDISLPEKMVQSESEVKTTPQETQSSTKDDNVRLDAAYEIVNTKHTKTGEELFIVRLSGKSNRLSDSEYQGLKAKAKSVGGFWDKFSRGFRFESDQKRQSFIDNAFAFKEDNDVSDNALNEPEESYQTKGGDNIRFRLTLDADTETEVTEVAKKKSAPSSPSLRKLKKGEFSRVEMKYSEDKNFIFDGRNKIESADDVAYLLRQLETKSVENMFATLVAEDGTTTVIHLSMGGRHATIVDFGILADAIHRFKPAKVFLAHNHPSGNLEPSTADINLHARAIAAFGDVIQEHIIIDTTRGEYASFRKGVSDYSISDRRPNPLSEPHNYKVIKLDEAIYNTDPSLPTNKITSSRDVASFLTGQRFSSGGKMSAIILARSNAINAYLHLPSIKLDTDKGINKLHDLLQAYAGRFGGSGIILSGTIPTSAIARHYLTDLKSRLAKADISLLDYIEVASNIAEAKSMADYGLLEPPTEYKAPTTAGEKLEQILGENIGKESKDDTRFRILGETGATNLDKSQEATTRMDNLSVAREMETAGKDTKDIRMATGWEKGADGKWKYELPDGELKLSVDDILNLPKTNNQWFTNEMPISDIIDMDNVINAYPEVKDYKVIFFDHGTHQELSTGSFADAERGVIAISLDPSIRNTGKVIPEQNKLNNAGYGGASSIATDKNSLKSAIVHEVQHLLQRSEGTNSGGNVEQVFKATIADKLAEIEAQDWTKDYSEAKKRQLAEAYVFADRGINTGSNYSDKIVLYARLSGEVEARNVQSRMNLTPEERRNTLLSETEDVSREDQIFIYDALGKSESRTVSPTGFYSTVENALDKIKQDKGTPEQFKAMLLKNGAKQAELDWMDFDDSFEGKRSVTKQDIQDWIDSNRIEVEEVVKERIVTGEVEMNEFTSEATEKYNELRDIARKWEAWEQDEAMTGEEMPSWKNEQINEWEEEYRSYDYILESLLPQMSENPDNYITEDVAKDDTKYSQYQLPGAPLSKHTEILTDKGWVKLQDININDIVLTRDDESGIYEWKPVLYKPEVYSEKLYWFKSQSISQQVTESHQMIVRKYRRTNDFGIKRIPAKELWSKWEYQIPLTANTPENKQYELFGKNAEDVAEFVGWFLSEGWFVKNRKNGNLVNPCISQDRNINPQNCDRIDKLLKRLKFNYTTSGSVYYINVKPIPKELISILKLTNGSANKFIPELFFKQTPNVINKLLKGLYLGDGSVSYRKNKNPHESYSSKSKRLVDGIQILLMLVGKSGNISYIKRNDMWAIKTKNRKWANVDKAKHSIIDYNDIAYCVTVDNHSICVRHEGICSWTGNSNYRELLLTMPGKSKPKLNVTKESWEYGNINGEIKKIPGDIYQVYRKGKEFFKAKNLSEVKNGLKERISDYYGLSSEAKDEFKSSHFDEPNILAHVRFNERTVNGERVLFIEEIQSDWAQKGKKVGFKQNEANPNLIIAEENRKWIVKNTDTGEVLSTFEKEMDAIEFKLSKLNQNGKVPDMPFKQTGQWVNLAIRKVMRYAAENGFDRIAWTSGKIQADRYDLSKQVDKINWTKKGDTYDISPTKDGSHIGFPVGVKTTNLTKNEVADLVGKEIADKIEAETGKNYETGQLKQGSLSGLDLKVGGTGMKSFYDAIIPSAASKLGKPFGAKVENVNIQVKDGEPKGRYINPTITDAGYAMVRDTHNGNEEIYSPTNIPAERDQWLSDKMNNKEDRMDILTTVQSLPVTDAMRESVREGQPLFRKGEDTETDILSSFIKKADEQKQRATRARELGEKLGVPVKIITNRSQLPARISRQMDAGRVYPGVFDKRTGQVYILVNEAHDIADIEKTIAHEVVAHKGLRELFGAEKFDALLDDVYDNMSNADKLIISQRYGTTDSKVIADEYIASLAETGNMPSWAGRVIANVRSLLRKAGFNVYFSDADIIYLLWSSRNRLEKNASLTQYVDFKAREADVVENVRFSVKEQNKLPSTLTINSKERSTTNSKGQPIAQTKEGIENFWKWFGNSKVVDEQGRPLVVYHGTNSNIGDFTEFKTNYIGSANDRGYYGEGFYFTFNTDPQWQELSKGEAGYYGRNIIEAYIKSENPFDISSLSKYKGEDINIMGDEGIAFLHNVALNFPGIAKNITISKRGKRTGPGEYELEHIPITELPKLIDKYDKDLVIETIEDNDYERKYKNGYLKSKTETVEYDYTDTGGKKGSWESVEWLGNGQGFIIEERGKEYKYAEEEIRFNMIVDALEKYDGISADYHPEGYMTRNPEITEAIKAKEHDAIVQSMDGDEIVVFFPNQIKSATGNDGSFDPNNSDIRFRIAPKKNANPAGLDPRMVEGRFDKTREFLQDKMLSGKILMETIQKRGGKTPQSTDFYNAENRLHSRSLAMIEDFNDEELDKLNTTLAQVVFEHGVDLDDINQYLKAKSSLERNDNEGIDALNEDPLSDWSRGKVEGIITDFESKVPPGLVSKLWDDIKDATDYTIKQLYLGNVISKSAYEGMKARKYYVPLKSWQFKQGENPLDFYEYSSGDRTAYQGLRKAKGRGSEAADPLAFIQSAAHSAIVSANKNMMKHKMLMLARLNPDMKDLFNIKKIYVMQKGVDANGDPIYLNVIKDGDDAFSIINYDAAGNPTLVNEGNFQDLYDAGTIESKISKAHTSRRPQFFAAQHEIEVFENGNRYIVAFGDPNVANAINNANTYEPEITRKVQNIWLLGKLNRWVSANFTAKNPAFIPINWIRDFGYSVTSHGLQTDGNLKLFAKNYPKAIKGINNYLRGKADPTNNQIDKLYKAFRHYGGQTGYVHLREIKDLQENIQREVNLKGGKRIGIDKVRDNAIYKALGKSLDYMAIMSENSARFATFLASAEAGKSYEQAASDAKNISVNFNKKGRASGLFGSFYAFFNANIQGGHNFAHMAKHNKKQMAVTATSFLVAGYMLAELLRSFGPEDDDEKSEYEKLPDYVREQSLVIPAGDNGFITIPLPFGFREIYGIGVTLSDMAHGKSSPGEGMFSIMESAISAFSPIQPTSIEIKQGRPPLRSLVPTVAVPWYDIAVNQGFTGRELYKVPFVKNMERYTPNSELGAYNANSIMKGITSKINELGGGNEYTPAGLNIKSDGQIDFSGTRKFLFDWNPSKAEHLLEYYLGGRGRFFNDIFKTTQAAISSEKEVMSYNIPIFKRLYTKPYSGLHWNDYREIQTEVEDFNYLLKESEKRGDYETMQRLQGNYKMLTISDMLKSYDKPIKEIGDAIKVITDPEAKKELQKNRDLLIKNFVKQSQSIIQEPNN